MGKRAQVSGENVAALLLLIALFMLFFMLFIPPAEREKLLPDLREESTKNISSARISTSGKTILAESPGEVFASSKDSVLREMPTVSLFMREVESRVKLANSLIVSRGIISSEKKTLRFNMDKDNVQSVNLFLFITESKGDISITLNGNRIFEGGLSSSDVPIELPVSLIGTANELLFSSESFNGRYEISNLELKVVSIEENRKATRSFVLTPAEKSILERATLLYFLNCQDLENVGQVGISLNNQLISSGLGVCDVRQQKIDLAKEKLKAGTNILSFEIEGGDYLIEDLGLELGLSEATFPKYQFELGDSDFRDLFLCGEDDFCIDDCDLVCDTRRCFEECVDDCEAECKDAVLELTFPEQGRKKATITINEFEINFETTGSVLERDISDFLHRGSNFIKIIPRNTFEISNLMVFIE